jgi:hypothetical protein
MSLDGLMTTHSHRIIRLLGVIAVAALGLSMAPAAAQAIQLERFEAGALNASGGEETQAGATPYAIRAWFQLTGTTPKPPLGSVYADGTPKTAAVELPAGLLGNPIAVPQCPRADLEGSKCPLSSQVGTVILTSYASFISSFKSYIKLPVFNMRPREGEVADFGFVYLNVPIHINVGLDASRGYAVSATSTEISQALEVNGALVTIWGTPADPSHNPDRGNRICGGPTMEDADSCQIETIHTVESLPEPYLISPTFCGPSLTSRLRIDSWEEPSIWLEASSTTQSGPTGCDRLTFDPSIRVQVDTSRGDSPTGLGVDIDVPQNEGASVLNTSDLRKAVVKFPAGLVVNPSSADGLGSCSEAQIGLGQNNEGTCPDNSKLGTVEVQTPLLDHSLKGSVFLAAPHANPFDSLLALYMEVTDPITGVDVKLPGEVEADPVTGQLTSTFDETPQLPFSNLHLQLKTGPRSALRTPAGCGTYATTGTLTPWSAPQSGPPATPSDTFVVSAGASGSCPGGQLPNEASLSAGTANPASGSYSPFVLRLSRPDGSQELKALEATLPKGLLGRLKGTSYCPDAALGAAASMSGAAEKANPSCPVDSRVGSVDVAAGAGSNPIHVTGTAYLAGPYKGAPLSLAIVTPAVAGPFDLGTVVVRNALYVNSETTQITVKSDPFPTILEGIPLDIRSIAVSVDKPEFTLNPTNCDPQSLTAGVLGVTSLTSLSNPFQVANCERLAFQPKVALRLQGAPPRRGATPKLQATVTAAPGEANIGRAAVILPATELLEQGHIRTVCTRVQFAADQCPAASIYGTARAFTPLLDKPLEGPVYLRSNGGERTLPDLVADLKGQIDVNLVGYIDSVKRKGAPRIRTRFLSVPDAPVSKFVLEMQGGKKGLLVNNTNLCKAKPHAEASLSGQNGKLSETQPLVSVGGCGKKGKPKKK